MSSKNLYKYLTSVILTLVFFLVTAAAAYSQITVFKGKLPTDENYWKYHEWYVNNNTVVSLVVSGKDRDALLDALRDLSVLLKRKVLIGSVIINGGLHFAALRPDIEELRSSFKKVDPKIISKLPTSLLYLYKDMLGPSEFKDIAQEIKLDGAQYVNIEDIIKKFNLTFSPAWIVRYKGKDYVFEGQADIKNFFSADGKFNAPGENSFFE